MHVLKCKKMKAKLRKIKVKIMKKSKVLCLLLIAIIFLITGCVSKDAKVHGQRKVLEYVDSVCTEEYELLGRELIAESPDNMEYYFKAKNRDLTFKANSYLRPISIDATVTSFYQREISCDYVNCVKGLYADEVKAVIQDSPIYVEESSLPELYLLSFADIDTAVDSILAADAIYKSELDYNSAEFLMENPVDYVDVYWYEDIEQVGEWGESEFVGDFPINGQLEREEVYEELADAYAQLVVEGTIENSEDVPEEYIQDKHVTFLETIELDGEEMLYDSVDEQTDIGVLSTDRFKRCWYNEEIGSYLISIDMGYRAESTQYPMINREYVNALGGTYELSEDETRQGYEYNSAWTIGDNRWEMTAFYKKNEETRIRELEEITIERNGEELDVDYITADDDKRVRGDNGGDYAVGVTVDDFCKLFNLNYEIDEDAGTIRFYSAED